MEDFVCALANNAEMKNSFEQRISAEEDPAVREKLEAKMKYFNKLPMKNGLMTLKNDRSMLLQERITAKRFAHRSSWGQSFWNGRTPKSELQSVFEANILKSQGQNSVLNRMEDISARLQEKLDECGQIDKDTAPDEEIRDKRAAGSARTGRSEKEELEKEGFEKEGFE